MVIFDQNRSYLVDSSLKNHRKEANAIVQQFNNIQNPKGEPILGHLTRGNEETKLTSAGGLLDPNGQPILGPKPEPGCLLDINGKPIKPYLSKLHPDQPYYRVKSV